MDFGGFPAETRSFLAQLRDHNDRDWFQAHKARYEEAVLSPSLDFIRAMSQPLHRISPFFLAVPKKSGGSLMRIYRDTRFAKDKSPYKTNIGIHFRHELGRDVHAPGYYVHVEPDEVFIGAGIWHLEADALRQIRTRIVDEPSDWQRARDNAKFREQFTLAGDSLKRPPRDFPADHPMVEDLKRKDFIAVRSFAPAQIEQPEFLEQVVDGFGRSRPLMRFLCQALNVPF